MLGVDFISSDKFRLFKNPFLTEFFCYSDFRYKVTEYLCSDFRYKVTEYLCSFFRQISTIQLAIFDGIFFVIPTFDTKQRNICARVDFFSSDKFRLFN